MCKKIVVILAVLALLALPISSYALASNKNDLDSIKESPKNENTKNGTRSIGNAKITITLPRKGWIHVCGKPVMYYGKTIWIGSTIVYIKGYAESINLLECIVKNSRGDEVYRSSISNFGTGSFSFSWKAKRGDYTIIVWEGHGGFPSAYDSVYLKVA